MPAARGVNLAVRTECDEDTCIRPRIAQRVDGGATMEFVSPGSALNNVVSSIPVQDVGTVAALQDVIGALI